MTSKVCALIPSLSFLRLKTRNYFILYKIVFSRMLHKTDWLNPAVALKRKHMESHGEHRCLHVFICIHSEWALSTLARCANCMLT